MLIIIEFKSNLLFLKNFNCELIQYYYVDFELKNWGVSEEDFHINTKSEVGSGNALYLDTLRVLRSFESV